MHVALVTVESHEECTLKDVAGGYGTVFRIGRSAPARLLARMKRRVARLPHPVLGYLAAFAARAGHRVTVHRVRRGLAGDDPAPDADLAVVLSSLVDAHAERAVLGELAARGVPTRVVGAFAGARPGFFRGVADTVVVGEPEALGEALFEPLPPRVDAGQVADLDALPWPDWSAFPRRDYRYAFLTRRGVILPIAGARGCAFGCDYCPFRVTAAFRERDPGRVVDEARHLRDRWDARGLAFRDPLFNLSGERVRALARGLAPLGLRFSAEMRADRLDGDALEALARAGLRSLEIGVESVDRGMLDDHHRKPPTAAHVEDVVRHADRLGIRVIANFMLGLPGDREDTFRATVDWAKRLNAFAVQFTVATPYPGTSLEPVAADRLLRRDPGALTGFTPTFRHPTLAPERIESLREWAYVSYFYRPAYLRRFAGAAVRSLLDARASVC